MTTTNEVTIENIGPIEQLTLTAKPGTITVLTGPNGAGKSQALNAVDSLVSGKTRLGNRDGTTGGKATGFGVQIKVGRGSTNRRSGDLEIESVEDRLNIAHLVDPGLKDALASDARRIKALVTLAGADSNPELFYDLAGGKEAFLSIVKPDTVDKPDIVSLAAGVKKDFESASRKEAAVAENLKREIRSKEEANEGIEIDAPHDADELQSAFEASIQKVAAEKQRSADATKAIEAAATARLRIEETKSAYVGPNLHEADEHLAFSKREEQEAITDHDTIREQMTKAVSLMQLKRHNREMAEADLLRAQENSVLITKWESDVKAAENVEPPDEDTVSILECRVGDAREAIETGVRVRDARERHGVIKLLYDQGKLASKNSERLRDAAHGCEDILSRLVADMGGVFKVDKEFRLVVQHPKRGATYFSELSHGERWKLGLDVAIEAFRRDGKRGLLAIPQECWESQDFENRRLIAKHIEGSDLAVITAEASREGGSKPGVGVKTFE